MNLPPDPAKRAELRAKLSRAACRVMEARHPGTRWSVAKPIEFKPYATNYGHTLERDGVVIADVEYLSDDEADAAVFVTLRSTRETHEYASVDAAIEALA